MNNRLMRRSLAASILVCGLSACSTIKSWFPDKERDYQFTTEIPELIIPDDLKHKGMPSLSRPEPAVTAGQDHADTAHSTADSTTQNSSIVEPDASVANEQAAAETQTAASIANGASSLQIDQGKIPATRMVGRALTRQRLEIVERNVDKGYFYVKFDPDAVKVTDDSIFDEFNFMFGDDPNQEQEYRITVHGLGPQASEVLIADNEGKILSNAAANALLKLITEGINQVENQDNQEAKEPQNSEEIRQANPETPVTEPETKPETSESAEPAAEQKTVETLPPAPQN